MAMRTTYPQIAKLFLKMNKRTNSASTNMGEDFVIMFYSFGGLLKSSMQSFVRHAQA